MSLSYVVGVVNDQEKTIQLHEAMPVSMVHTVKHARTEDSSLIKEKSALARNELGQTFGTKKRKKIIKDMEINQIRVENMQDVAAKIKETIAETAKAIPLQADLEKQIMDDRLIPPCNIDVFPFVLVKILLVS